MIFFTCNAIETHLVSTGAFEIYLNSKDSLREYFYIFLKNVIFFDTLDMQIWSKLSSDRIPHDKELLQMIDMNLNLESHKQS